MSREVCGYCGLEVPCGCKGSAGIVSQDSELNRLRKENARLREALQLAVDHLDSIGLGFCEGSAVKYLTRWRSKGGVDDLRKAKHFIELLIEMEMGK